MEAQELLDTFEQEVWRRNLRRDLPEGDARTQFQSVTVSQSPYMAGNRRRYRRVPVQP